MKRFWIILTAILLVISFGACAEDPNTDPDSGTTVPEQEETHDRETTQQTTAVETTEQAITEDTSSFQPTNTTADIFEDEPEVDFSDFETPVTTEKQPTTLPAQTEPEKFHGISPVKPTLRMALHLGNGLPHHPAGWFAMTFFFDIFP